MLRESKTDPTIGACDQYRGSIRVDAAGLRCASRQRSD
jgi:hypothetical protein